VEFLYQKVKEGMTLNKIAQTLNDLGVPTRQRFGNNIWTGARISEMLADPKYMGKYHAFTENYTRNGDKYTRTKKPLEECVLMPEGVCPAKKMTPTQKTQRICLNLSVRDMLLLTLFFVTRSLSTQRTQGGHVWYLLRQRNPFVRYVNSPIR